MKKIFVTILTVVIAVMMAGCSTVNEQEKTEKTKYDRTIGTVYVDTDPYEWGGMRYADITRVVVYEDEKPVEAMTTEQFCEGTSLWGLIYGYDDQAVYEILPNADHTEVIICKYQFGKVTNVFEEP